MCFILTAPSNVVPSLSGTVPDVSLTGDIFDGRLQLVGNCGEFCAIDHCVVIECASFWALSKDNVRETGVAIDSELFLKPVSVVVGILQDGFH